MAAVVRFLPVEGVTDFDNDEDGERHRLWMWIVEDLTVETRKHPWLSQTLHVVGLTDPSNYVTYTCIEHKLLLSVITNKIIILAFLALQWLRCRWHALHIVRCRRTLCIKL